MAAKVDRWSGRRVRHWLFAIWSTASLAACAKYQFSRIYALDVIPYVFAWAAAYVLLTCITTLVAGIRSSWAEGLRSFAESLVILLATVAAMFGLEWTFHGLGLGHWPPRDGVYVRIFRERRAEWTAERDRVLREWKAESTDPAKRVDASRQGTSFNDHYANDGRVRDLGAEAAVVANDGTWIRFIFYEGQIHEDPVREKGLLYVDPQVAAHSDARWVDHLAVEELGDGWYVYER
jgi:hypothetical protein